jgi:ABC-type branched-subunit amino acid transport system substrate-binding protein
MGMNRRQALALLAAMGAAGAARLSAAQGAPIQLGGLVPLTGSGGSYGPSMAEAQKWVVGEVNGAGGIKGRPLNLTVEDDQTNPDSGVRAARKLIDVNQVVAIMGTWASSVTTAVAPLCWESHTFLTTTSGADRITQLPHNGYLIRTEPTTTLIMTKLGNFLVEQGIRSVFMVSAQTPFAEPAKNQLAKVLESHGAKLVGQVIYDRDKTSFRSELDLALKDKPEMIFLDGYTPDVTILLRDLYRTGYEGKKLSRSYAINEKLLSSLPPEVTEGVITISPSPEVSSPSYHALAEHLKVNEIDAYTCQAYDQANLVCLALAQATEPTGTGIRNAIHNVSDPGGTVVASAVDGIRLIRLGGKVKYAGVSGPCVFNDIGDIVDTRARFETIHNGKPVLLKITA